MHPLAVALIIFVIILIIGSITFGVLYGTCNWPFAESDRCLCKNSEGAWDNGCTCTNKDLIEKKCVLKCKDDELRNATTRVCEKCPENEKPVGDKCECISGKYRDPADSKCKSSNIYRTNKFDKVLCPNDFTTAYDAKITSDGKITGDKICNTTNKLCDACVSLVKPAAWPLKYVKYDKTYDWPARPWANLNDTGFDLTPSCTGGRTFRYEGDVHVTNAMPLNCP